MNRIALNSCFRMQHCDLHSSRTVYVQVTSTRHNLLEIHSEVNKMKVDSW